MRHFKHILTFFLMAVLSVWPSGIHAQQVDEIVSRSFQVCWSKTFHLIYPTDVKYFSLGDDNVVGEKVESCPNVIRLKANVKDFKGATNLTVVTADSKYFSYMITYTEDVSSPFRYEGASSMPDRVKYTLPVTDSKLSHIIFPTNLIYVDYGDETVEVTKASGVENIIAVRASSAFVPETNVSVMTEERRFYTFNLSYQPQVPVLSFIVDKDVRQQGQVAILDDREMNVMQKDSIRHQIAGMARNHTDLKETIGGVEFSIHNVMVKDNTIFLKMQLDNSSNVNYSIDFIRFYIQDQKKSKRTAEQQLELVPLFYFDYTDEVRYHQKAVFTAALEKFTIPDKKECIIEIQEGGGGRHFYFKLRNKYLLNAQVLLTHPVKMPEVNEEDLLPVSPFTGINDDGTDIWSRPSKTVSSQENVPPLKEEVSSAGIKVEEISSSEAEEKIHPERKAVAGKSEKQVKKPEDKKPEPAEDVKAKEPKADTKPEKPVRQKEEKPEKVREEREPLVHDNVDIQFKDRVAIPVQRRDSASRRKFNYFDYINMIDDGEKK